jgi:hypothetical protein
VGIDRVVGLSPATRPKALVHLVRLEPNLRNSDYSVARYGMWRKLSQRVRKQGIEFQTPITLNDTRYLYEITRSLVSLCRLSLTVSDKWQIRDAVRIYHDLRLFLLGRREVTQSTLVKQYFKVIAVNLRFAKSTLRVAGHRVSNPPVLNREPDNTVTGPYP